MDTTETFSGTQQQVAAADARDSAARPSSFEQRFAEALRRRLYPNTSLRLKTLSRDTGYSEDTITRWTQAKHRVFAGAVEDLATYFADRYGDASLLCEVFAAAGASALRPLSLRAPAWPGDHQRVARSGAYSGEGRLAAGEETARL